MTLLANLLARAAALRTYLLNQLRAYNTLCRHAYVECLAAEVADSISPVFILSDGFLVQLKRHAQNRPDRLQRRAILNLVDTLEEMIHFTYSSRAMQASRRSASPRRVQQELTELARDAQDALAALGKLSALALAGLSRPHC